MCREEKGSGGGSLRAGAGQDAGQLRCLGGGGGLQACEPGGAAQGLAAGPRWDGEPPGPSRKAGGSS